jgi:hypothetical protein
MRHVFSVLTACVSLNVAASNCESSFSTPEFISGDYEMLLREPGSNEAYTAQAKIVVSSKDKSVTLLETRQKSAMRRWQGKFRDASPGDGCVLELDSAPYRAGCLVSVDLDNYARLTCRVGFKAKPYDESPGIAALFPLNK